MILTIGKINFFLGQEFLNKNFMRNRLFLILFLTSSLIYTQNNIAVLKTDANIRWEASTNSGIIKVLPKGQVVIIESKKRKWSFIKNPDDGKKGWASNSLLSSSLIYKTTKQPNITQPKIILKNVVPNCDYEITSPRNDADNVSTKATIKWEHGTGNPKGYYFTILASVNGSSEYVKTKDGRIIRRLNIGDVNLYSIPNLKPFTTYKIGILPYNDIGLAYDCEGVFSFTTGPETTGSSVDQIIENRLKNFSIGPSPLPRWQPFKKTMRERIVMNNYQTSLFMKEIEAWKGVPFKLGGTDRNGIDCSGLIWKGLREAVNYKGDKLNAQMWAQSGKLIANISDLKRGDLICFTNTRSDTSSLVHHIVIYLGDDKFWHAPSKGKVVKQDNLSNPYWNPRFIFGVRFSK